MTKREQYGLCFYKMNWPDGTIHPQLKVEKQDNSLMLNLINYLDENETVGFLFDLERCIDSKRNVDEGFQSDYFCDIDVLYQYPDVNFSNLYSIPMVDLKEILEEWLVFIRPITDPKSQFSLKQIIAFIRNLIKGGQ